jgi:hypothetical protein
MHRFADESATLLPSSTPTPSLKPKRPRFSESFESRLAAYASAAAAAGVGLLAVSTPANAEVVFTPAHTTFINGQVYIDVNHDGINDVLLSIYQFATQDRRLAVSALTPDNGVLGYIDGSSYPLRPLNRGYRIGAGDPFFQRPGLAANVATTGGTVISGPWPNVGTKFVGLKFQISGETHYGWVAVNVKAKVGGHAGHIQATVLGYAYETDANKPIYAGNIGGAEDASAPDAPSDSGTLHRLARGARASE